MLAGALNRFAPSTHGWLSPAVAVTISCSRSGLRWSSISNHVDADNCSAAAKPLSAMPYPNGALPLLGHQLLLRKHNKNISNLFDHYFGELGPIYRMKLPAGYSMVLIREPEVAEVVFRNEGQYPTRIQMLDDNLQWLFKKLHLPVPFPFLTREEWKVHRSAHNQQIKPANIFSYAPGMNKVTNRLMKNLESSKSQQGYVENIGSFLSNWAMEASAYFSLGADLDLGGEADPEAREFQQAVSSFISCIADFTRALPIYRLVPTPLYYRATKAVQIFYNIGKKYLDSNMEKIQRCVEKGEKVTGQSLIEQWMLEKRMSEDEIIISAVGMFGAGVDTTAHTATFMLYELAKHPEVQEKLRNHVLSVLGESEEADVETLQKMPYLIQVIRETQRKYPVATLHTRTLDSDIELLGYHIPAKTIIVYVQFTVTKDERYFNEPHKFNPDRWKKGSENIHPFALLPFGFGPRACWGRRFSEVELKILLTHVCREFILESHDPPDSKLPTIEQQILRPSVPVNMKFIRRQ